MRRPSLLSVGAVLVALVGAAALARGAVPQAAASGGDAATSPPIVVTGAYIRVPASPELAAVYLTIYNTTSEPDTLTAVIPGFGETASIHSEVNGNMVENTNGLVIPAHGSATLKPTNGHIMVENVYGTLSAGQTVNLELDFTNAGPVLVTVPVIGIYDPLPAGAAK
jgi:periplasmic copper chaperone A